jgi:hypothetical protein
MGRALSRSLGLLAILFAFALVFWLTAVLMSSFPNTFAVAVNVHGLNLPGSGDSSQRPAPLSLSVLDDAQQDAGTISNPIPTPASTAVPSRGPVATPSPTPVRPTPTPTPSPTATPFPLPLPTPTPSPSATPAPATIAGQVIDGSTRLAIIGATVSASPGGASTTTDVNGNYSLGVSAGSYTVTASAPTYNSASQSVSVKAGQQLPLNFKLTSITAYGSLTGTVTDAVTHAPIVGATVTLSDGMIRTTDLSGNFSYSIVLNGTYTLTVSALGYVTQSQLVSIKAGHTTTVQIQLTH